MTKVMEILCVAPFGATLPAGVVVHDPDLATLSRFRGHFEPFKAKAPKKVTILQPVTIRRGHQVTVSELPKGVLKSGQFEAVSGDPVEEGSEDPDLLADLSEEQKALVFGLFEQAASENLLDKEGLPDLDLINGALADKNAGLVLTEESLRALWSARLGTLV